LLRTTLLAMTLLIAGVAPVLAQDAAAGEKDFLVCRACHQIGPTAKNAVGPVLNGVVGRKAGTYAGFTYSDANKGSGLVWTPEELDKYLTSPQTVVPHTKMIFPGLKDAQKRQDVIAYLGQFGPDGQKKQ
jgi:cytochrome c